MIISGNLLMQIIADQKELLRLFLLRKFYESIYLSLLIIPLQFEWLIMH